MTGRRVIVYPRAGRPHEVRLWVGVRGAKPEQLRFYVDGRLEAFEAVRDLAPVSTGKVRGEALWTGVYRWHDSHGARRKLEVAVGPGLDDVSDEIATRPLPGTLPKRGFRVVMGSCYYRKNDNRALASSLKGKLAKHADPDLTLLLGDQVYLDAPYWMNWRLPRDIEAIEATWKKKYLATWLSDDGLRPLLRLAPTACVPDDHEYWNNFPHATAVTGWRPGNDAREAWTDVARRLYERFQHGAEDAAGVVPLEFDVPPLSFFMLDSRAHRGLDAADGKLTFNQLLHPVTLERLIGWRAHLRAQGLIGVIATSQSILTELPGWLGRKRMKFIGRRQTHAEMFSYAEFDALCGVVNGILEDGSDLLWLAGDVHWGRIAKATSDRRLCGMGQLFEVVSSPLSLVDGAAAIPPLNRAPRHADPPGMGENVRNGLTLGRHKYTWRALDGLAGDQWCSLDFREKGRGVQVNVALVPTDAKRPVHRAEFLLQRHR